MSVRSHDRGLDHERFLNEHGWFGVEPRPIQPDASFRRYFRLRDGDRNALLMDAPEPHEDVGAFARVAQHLTHLGLHAPSIFAVDADMGLALIEDFGDRTFTRLLAEGAVERELYAGAVDTLITLHTDERATDVDVPPYSAPRLVEEAALLADWYLPVLTGSADPGAAHEFRGLWRDLVDAMPSSPPALVLRDYHVDNLMQVDADDGTPACGLLDFQDAVIGPRAYDLMSLLEDARRDPTPALVADMQARYHQGVDTADPGGFRMCYDVLAAQRHCKVAGIFVRLCVRDRKPAYLVHVPRVLRLLQRTLDREPQLESLRGWLDRYAPARDLDRPPAMEAGKGTAKGTV